MRSIKAHANGITGYTLPMCSEMTHKKVLLFSDSLAIMATWLKTTPSVKSTSITEQLNLTNEEVCLFVYIKTFAESQTSAE